MLIHQKTVTSCAARRSDWTLHTARTGARKDARRALHELVALLDRGQRIDGLTVAPARLSGFIRR